VLPGGLAALPERLQTVAFPQRVHRLPEALVAVGRQLTAPGQLRQHIGLEQAGIGVDQITHRGLQHQKATIDPGLFTVSLFLEIAYAITIQVQGPVAAGGLHGREGGLQALGVVVGDQGAHVHIRNAIAVGEAEGFVAQVGAHPAETAAGFGFVAGVDEGDLPGLGGALVHLHVITHVHVEGDITGVQKVVGKILLDHVTLVAATHDEVVDAKGAVDLEDVPEDRHATHLHQGLGANHGFLSQACAPATSKDDGFQMRCETLGSSLSSMGSYHKAATQTFCRDRQA
jgi:hypothetical protein